MTYHDLRYKGANDIYRHKFSRSISIVFNYTLIPKNHPRRTEFTKIPLSHQDNCTPGSQNSQEVSVIAREKFGVAVLDELVDDFDELIEECADLGASMSEKSLVDRKTAAE